MLQIQRCQIFESRSRLLTDSLGEQLTKDGGIRYPDVNPMAIHFEVFENALNLLQQIASEVDEELSNKKG